MNQTKLESLAEQFVNIFFKFWVALACWMFFIPLVYPELETPATVGGGVTVIFTVLSIAQGYFWRRVFNKIHLTKAIHEWVKSMHLKLT